MKKYIWLVGLSVLCYSCAETQDDKAAPLLSHIEALYNSGHYRQTLDSIMILRKDYPEAIESRKKALTIWQNASLKMAQADVAKTDSALQATTQEIDTCCTRKEQNMLRVKRDSLKARYEAMCGVVKMIHFRQKQK